MRRLPNALTLCRMALAAAMLFAAPLSKPFFVLYALCGLTDVADGWLARRMRAVSAHGALLDSIADAAAIGVLLYRLLPTLRLPIWMYGWVASVAAVRIGSVAVGWARQSRVLCLHTHANKLAGLALYAAPVLLTVWNQTAAVALVCAVASTASVEELLIQCIVDQPSADCRGLYEGLRKQKEEAL